MKLWLVQLEPKLFDKQANTAKILDYVDRAADAGLDLVVFPEMALTGYMCQERFYELAEPVPGPSTAPIMEKAREKGVYVLIGLPELRGSYVYNSAALFGPDGLCGIWRKLVLATLWSPAAIYDEGMFFKPGVDIDTFDTRLGRVGVEICRDIYYPEITRAHAYRGALLLLCISAVPGQVYQRFHTLAKARALENCAWFGYVNQAGRQKQTVFGGGSCVIDQFGDVRQTASAGGEAGEEVIEQEIDMEQAHKERLSRWYIVGQTRPDILRRAADIVSEL
ncbi:MAG: carbon-nitrogen hydrolase family protein [Chloroflexi bacterium]|nr:carbon-nitrogen hydrolase family protein [Chloroflexota bacterium]